MFIQIKATHGITYLNVNQIVTIERKDDLTRISMQNNDVHYTKESPGDILAKIK